jgi:hypothetical protein
VSTAYNPLDRINLARSVELTLEQQACCRLPIEPFVGAGLYALYYTGSFPSYQPISGPRCLIPIYVGRAQPAGSRTGLVDLAAEAGPALWNRINDHVKSIEAATNLDLADFRVRYLVVEDIFIAMGEALLIQKYRPLWNVHLSGFGLHAPGSRRHGGDRSEWDELHPGRPWYEYMVSVRSPAELRRKLKMAFDEGRAATRGHLPASALPTESADVTETLE